MQLGIALGFSGAAAVKGFSNLSKTANAFKAQVEGIKGSKQLINDLKAAGKEFARLKSQSMTRLFTSGTGALINTLRDQLKAAGADTNNLKKATRELNAELAKTRLGQSQEAFQKAQSQLISTAAVGYVAAKPITAKAKAEDDVKDISITGEFTPEQEAALGFTLRKAALDMNQSLDAVADGVKTLVAGGIQSADELNRYAPVIAKTATATRAQMDDIGNTFLALANNMKISAADSESAMNIMIKSTKLGQVEFKDMAKWMPKLTPMLAAMGMSGKESVAQLASMLQVSKIGAGTADEAGNNLVNLLTKINAPDTVKDFGKVGIDLKSSLKASALNGVDPVTAMLDLVENYMAKALNPDDLAKYQAALAEKDGAKSAEMFKSLGEAGNMGQLFQDMQAMGALRALLQNKDKLKSFSADSLAAGGSDMLGSDFEKRTQGFSEQWKGLNIAITEFSVSVGDLLLPAIKTITGYLKDAAIFVGDFVKNNPEIAKMAGYVLAGVAAFKALSVGILLVKASSLATSAALTVLKVAIMTNPVTAAVIAIATAAYLLYENFGQVRSLFNGFWDGVMVGLSPVIKLFDGIGGKVSGLIESITGIKVATDESAFSWQVWGETAGIAIGSAISSVTDFIGQVIYQVWALPDTIKAAFEGLKQWFAELWQGILGGFTGFINTTNEALNTILPEKYQMHLNAPQLNQLPVPNIQPNLKAANDASAKGGDVIHFSPNITLPAGTSEQTVTSVKQALNYSQAEFEQRYKTMMKQQTRTGYAAQ
jgi:TP901 family phage tail tape measure protein